MNTWERMEDESCKNGVDIIEYNFNSPRIKGLYSAGTIAIHKDLNMIEKSCVLAEELGHHHTTVGNILDMKCDYNRKQERQARLWAYNRKIGLSGIVEAYKGGCQDKHDIAAYLEVTDEFLEEAVDCYRSKYGIGTTLGDYYIMFIPSLLVGKII